MFKRILVAIDGSAASGAGLKAAVALAADQRARLVVLHVVDDTLMPSIEGVVYPPSFVDSFVEALEREGRQLLDRKVAQVRRQGVEVEPALARTRLRTVARTILDQARQRKAGLIVLGTHGRRGLRRVLLGSDAETVVRESRVPVLLVRGPGAARETSAAPRKPRARHRV